MLPFEANELPFLKTQAHQIQRKRADRSQVFKSALIHKSQQYNGVSLVSRKSHICYATAQVYLGHLQRSLIINNEWLAPVSEWRSLNRDRTFTARAAVARELIHQTRAPPLNILSHSPSGACMSGLSSVELYVRTCEVVMQLSVVPFLIKQSSSYDVFSLAVTGINC